MTTKEALEKYNELDDSIVCALTELMELMNDEAFMEIFHDKKFKEEAGFVYGDFSTYLDDRYPR